MFLVCGGESKSTRREARHAQEEKKRPKAWIWTKDVQDNSATVLSTNLEAITFNLKIHLRFRLKRSIKYKLKTVC